MRGKIGLRHYAAPGGGITVQGQLRWEHNNAPIANALVTLSGDRSDSYITGADGMYYLSAPNGTNFVVTPTKNRTVANGALNGVTGSDSSRIGQHISGVSLFTSGYKMIAADVNNSRSVTSADQSTITSALIGNPVSQLNFVNRTWVFVPVSHVLPALPWPIPFAVYPTTEVLTTGIYTDIDFIGCKLGDVNGSTNPQDP
jgi:hypothetical protein